MGLRPPFLSSLSLRDNLVSVFANSWFALSTPLFQSVSGLLHNSSRGISAPRHAESLHRDRFGQKEGYRVGPAFSGCVMGFSCSTFMISGTW